MKNKEIEELLNELKEYASGGMSGLYPSEDIVKNFVSYIEQLEADYKEANDSITWWQNRFNSLMKKTSKTYKELCDMRVGDMNEEELFDFAVGLLDEIWNCDKRIDKAIEYVESHFIFNDKTGECYQTHTFDKDNVKKLYDILKGDSDE